jgi:hypothetical protein
MNWNRRRDEGHGSSKEDAHEYVGLRQMVLFVDWSKKPKNNQDRLRKLGEKAGTYAAYICDYIRGEERTFLADGFINDGKDASHQPFEPDCVALRRHKKPPKSTTAVQDEKIERVWAWRIIVDRENKQAAPENRSMLAICQRDMQLSTDVHNLFWIQKVPVIRRYLWPKEYDDAGILTKVCSNVEGTETVDPLPIGDKPITIKGPHLCLAINKRGGHWTDGNRVAQPWHLFSIPNEATDEYTDFIKSPDPDKKLPITTKKVIFSELMIRADGKFLGQYTGFFSIDCAMNSNPTLQRAHGPMSIDPDDRIEFEGVPISGHMCWSTAGRLNTPAAGDELDEDSKDDSLPLGRLANQFLRPFVCLPIATPPGIPPPTPPDDFIPTPGSGQDNKGYGGVRFRNHGDTDGVHQSGEPYVTGMNLDESTELTGVMDENGFAGFIIGVMSDGDYKLAQQNAAETTQPSNVIGILRRDVTSTNPPEDIDRIAGTPSKIEFEEGLSISPGDHVWLSDTDPGKATNVRPDCSLEVVVNGGTTILREAPWHIGTVEDTSDYAGTKQCIVRLHIYQEQCDCLKACHEVPAGTINGVNNNFTLDHIPEDDTCVMLYKNGLLQQQGAGSDYTIVGASITFEAGNTPQTGDILVAFYEWGCNPDKDIIEA